jgi:hypothetical protein
MQGERSELVGVAEPVRNGIEAAKPILRLLRQSGQ